MDFDSTYTFDDMLGTSPLDREMRIDPAWCYTCRRDTAFCLCVCQDCGADRKEGCDDDCDRVAADKAFEARLALRKSD